MAHADQIQSYRDPEHISEEMDNHKKKLTSIPEETSKVTILFQKYIRVNRVKHYILIRDFN